MTALFEEAQVKGLMDYMASLADSMVGLRKKEAQAKVDFESAQSDLSDLAQNKTFEIASREDVVEAIDPRTGKKNAEWAKLMTDVALKGDEDFQRSFASFQNAQKALYEAQVDVFSVSDKLGMAKATANLLAAYMGLSTGK